MPTAAPEGSPLGEEFADQEAPGADGPPNTARPRLRGLPSIGVGLVMVALMAVSLVAGQPDVSAVPNASAWFPTAGHRERLAESDGEYLLHREWSRPDSLSLGQSELIAYSYWAAKTDVDVESASYVRARSVLTDPFGTFVSRWDTLWTLGADGARAQIESTIPLDHLVMFPGRLDLPNDLNEGDVWTSEGTALRWDESSGAIVESDYRADYRATAAEESDLAGRGCLLVVMDFRVGEESHESVRAWCSGEGTVAFVDDTGGWSQTEVAVPSNLSDASFDWSTADDLEFSPRSVVHSLDGKDAVLSPAADLGAIQGDFTFANTIAVGVMALKTAADPAEVTWTGYPSGVPTSAATLGSVTVVVTTARTAVAYDSSGRWVWEAPLSDLSVVPPIRLGENAVSIATLDGTVTTFDLTSGAVLWRTGGFAEIRAEMVAAGDRLLVGDQDGQLVCLDGKGAVVWAVAAGEPRSIMASGGPDPVVVFGGDVSLKLKGYSLADGRMLWEHQVNHQARQLIALDGYIALLDYETVLGVDPTSGAVLWEWSGPRAWAGIGGWKRLLLMTSTDLILLDDAGRQVRSWPHHSEDVSAATARLVAGDGRVLAYDGSLDIGVVP